MSGLASILYPAPTPTGLEEWFHAHLQHHIAIIDAVRQNFNTNLQLYPLYPVNMQDTSTFLRDHQIMHNEMASALSISSTDISSVDFKNKKEFDAWVYQHFLQHQAAAELCGVPI